MRKIYFFMASQMLMFSAMALPPEEGLKRLMDGNKRFTTDKMIHGDKGQDRRDAIVSKQEPFAVIVGCSDSRVAPELVFDEGLGDLFVVRVAGNVVGPVELDSIEYSALVLHSSLIMVLGHESCGAVRAVLDGNTKDIEAVADLILGGIKGKPSIEVAIKDNVRHSMEIVKRSPALEPLFREKKLKIVGGYYNLNTGVVDLID